MAAICVNKERIFLRVTCQPPAKPGAACLWTPCSQEVEEEVAEKVDKVGEEVDQKVDKVEEEVDKLNQKV